MNHHRAPTARIVVEHDHALIKPVEPALLPLLRHESWGFAPGTPEAEQIAPRITDFGRLDATGRLRIMPGLVRTVRGRLHELGYRVQIDDRRRYGVRLRPDAQVLDEAVDAERDLMDVVARRPTGQIVCPKPRDVVQRMISICRLFPRARVIVPTATKGRARQFWLELRRELGVMVQLAAGDQPQWARIVVARA
ncbi:MAG: hypothetical protein ACOC9P_00905 [bacterium]